MLCVPHPMSYTVCFVFHILWHILYALCSTSYVIYRMLCVPNLMTYTVCFVFHILCHIPYALCSTSYDIYCMLCVPRLMTYNVCFVFHVLWHITYALCSTSYTPYAYYSNLHITVKHNIFSVQHCMLHVPAIVHLMQPSKYVI